jgi:hypothetical protein
MTPESHQSNMVDWLCPRCGGGFSDDKKYRRQKYMITQQKPSISGMPAPGVDIGLLPKTGESLSFQPEPTLLEIFLYSSKRILYRDPPEPSILKSIA